MLPDSHPFDAAPYADIIPLIIIPIIVAIVTMVSALASVISVNDIIKEKIKNNIIVNNIATIADFISDLMDIKDFETLFSFIAILPDNI